MSESPTKKHKSKHFNYQKYSYKQRNKYIEAGMVGFLVTTNFKQRDGVREAYMILNQYHDKMFGDKSESEAKEKKAGNDDEDEEDISSQLQSQIEQTKKDTQEKSYKFQSVETGTNNCIFIKTTVDNHRELGIQLIKDTYDTKQKITKSLIRFFPVDVVCKANIKDIIDASGKLFDKFFLKEPTEYSIVFNKRYNNDVNRDEVIKELAELIGLKNKGNKVNLKFPKLSVIVEVIKGLCCLSVLPNYLEYRKYNLVELCAEKPEASGENGNNTQSEDKDKETEQEAEAEEVPQDQEPSNEQDA